MPLSPLYLWQWYKTEYCTHNTMGATNQSLSYRFPHNRRNRVWRWTVCSFVHLWAESSGWMVDEISNVYVVVTLPGHHTPLFFKVMKKKSRTEDNWLLNVVSVHQVPFTAFFKLFIEVRQVSGKGRMQSWLNGPFLWDWSFWKNFKWSEMTKLPSSKEFCCVGWGEEREGRNLKARNSLAH